MRIVRHIASARVIPSRGRPRRCGPASLHIFFAVGLRPSVSRSCSATAVPSIWHLKIKRGTVATWPRQVTGNWSPRGVSPKGPRSRRFFRGFDRPKGTPNPKGLKGSELCPDPNRNEGARRSRLKSQRRARSQCQGRYRYDIPHMFRIGVA